MREKRLLRTSVSVRVPVGRHGRARRYRATAWLRLALLALAPVACGADDRQPVAAVTPTVVAATSGSMTTAPETASGATQDGALTSPDTQAQLERGVALIEVADGFAAPIALADAGGGVLLVADQTGVIRAVGGSGEGTFLDVSDRLVGLRGSYDERGLLGMALDPEYSENGRIFLYYSAPRGPDTPRGWDHESVLSVFVRDGGDGVSAAQESEQVLLRVPQPQANHNGGSLAFGPDGFLYLALGDGGSANDSGTGHSPGGNGQDPTNLLGSILRLDVSGDAARPARGNPQLTAAAPETYAFGFRNPFRISFDAATGQLFAGDVGQNLWEEVSIVVAGGNHGWPVREGPSCFDQANPGSPPASCAEADANGRQFVSPILSYRNAGAGGDGLAVIGGYVYRGEALPQLEGRYVFGDWSSSFAAPRGSLFVATEDGAGWRSAALAIEGREGLEEYLLSLGQDSAGELYLLTTLSGGPSGSSGRVYRLGPLAGP
jgi:glucose/arabinose dehydrogenase